MQRITPMVDDSGAVYEVGDADRPRFDELMKGRAQQRHTFRGTDGQTYEVPEADRERFQSLVPDAEEIHRFQMDDGESVAISDSGARSLRDASFEGGISRKAWKDAGLPEKYGRSAKERAAFAQFLGESGFQGVREQEQRANFEKSIRDFTQNPVFPQIPSPEHPGPMDFEGAMKRFNEINALREKPIVPGDPNAPDLGVFEREYLNAVASSGNENAGWASITGRMLPVIGSFIRADDARVNDVYRRIMNGGFKDTFSMRKAVRTIGIPDEIIEEVERNARVGKTAMGFPVLDDKKVEEGLKSVIAPLYQAREAAKGRAAMALNESAPPSAMTEMVSGALHLPSGVAELTPLGFALSAFPNALAKAEDHISKGDSEGEALTKAFASEGVDYLVWNKLGKLVEMIPGAKNVVKGTAQKLARNSVTGSVVGQNALQLLEMNAKSGLIDLANNVVGLDKASSEEKADFGEWVEDFLSVPGNAKKMLMMLPAHLMMKGSGKIRQMSTAEGRKMAADAKAQRKLVEDYIGKEEARGLSDQDVGNLYRLVSSENFSEEAVRNFISGIEGDAGQANLRAAARTAGDVRQGLEDIESLSVPKGESEAYKAMARKADMDAQNAEYATREQEAGDAFVNNQLTREGNERIRAEKRQRKAEEAAERERAEREAREAAEEQERAIAEKAAEDNKPTIRVTGPEAESAPADRKTEYPEYAEWLRKNGRSDTDKNWNKFVAQNEMDPALKVVRDKKGKPVEPEPPAPAKAVQPQESAASTEVASLSVQRKELQAKFDANLDENGNPKDAETAHALEKELDKIDSRLGEIEAANPGTLPQDLKAVARMPKAEGKGTKAPETEGGDVPAPAEAKKPTELPTDDNGQVVGEVGDSIELENGMKATVTRRKNGGKKWTITQGKRWTTDGGKTWHDGLKPGDKFTDEDFEAPDKVPANVHFNHQKNDSGIWEVDFIRKDGSYELKPVPAEPAKNGPVSAPAEGGTITPAKPAEAPRAAEPKPGEPPKVAETATGAKDPVVDETGSAAEVVPPDSVEARISAMKRGSPEQLKAQREYLEQEIAKARAAIDGKFGKLENYGGRGRVKWLPKDEADDLPPTVTVKVPGDGEFTVKNTPEGMDFLDKVAAKFKPQKSGKAAEASAPSVPRPPTVAVAKTPKAEAAPKEMEPFVSTDRTRASLMKPMSDGKYVYATNGKIVVRRPQRKGETVKGVDGAPVESCAGFFDNPEPDHSFKVKVAELYPKLVQADAVTGDGDGKGIIELWHDGNGTLHVRARDGEGNSYATDAGSDYVSRPLTLVNGQYLRDFLKLAAKRGAGELEIGIVKNGIAKQADAVTLKGGDLDGVLVSITNPEEIFKARAEKDAQIESYRMLSYGERAWVDSLPKKLREERDGLVATASQSGTTIDNELKAKIAKAKDDLAAFDAKHGKSEFVSEFVKNGGKAPAKPKKGKSGVDGKLKAVNPDADGEPAAGAGEAAGSGAKGIQGEFGFGESAPEPQTPEQEIAERLDLARLDPKRRSDPKVLEWAKKNGRKPLSNGMVTPDAVRAYDEAMTEASAKKARRWFPDMKIVTYKYGETIKRGQHVIERRRAGNYHQMPSAEEQSRIAKFDRKHPSLFGAGRILLSKGETARIYSQLAEKGFLGKERYGDERDLFSAYTHETDPITGTVRTTVYACEYLGDNMFKPYCRAVEVGDLSGDRREALYNRIRKEFDTRAREAGNRLRNGAGDLVVDLGEPKRGGDDNGASAPNGKGDKAQGAGGNDKGNSPLPDANNAKAENGDVSYLRDRAGRVLGWFDPQSKEVHLLPGADPRTVAHEIMWHGTREYISGLAANGDAKAQMFLDMMHDVERNAPQAIKDVVNRLYARGSSPVSRDTLLNEYGAWFTMDKGGAALEKAMQTADGRIWFAKGLYAVKEMYKDYLTRHGKNRVDLSAVDGMTRDQFVDWIADQFAGDKTLGTIKGPQQAVLSTKETKFQAARRRVYDVNAPVRDLERDVEKKTGQKISTDDSVEAANALKHGLKEAANIEIQGKMSDFRKTLGESGIHYEDLEYYAALKAAAGRDAKIDARNLAKIEADMRAQGASQADIDAAKARYRSVNGSHIDPREARRMIAEIEGGPDAAKYKAAYDKLRAVIDETLAVQEQSGLVGAADAAKWRAEEPNYVPFKNEYKPETGEWAGRGSSRNFTRPEHHTAKGRQSAAGDIIAHVFMDHQAAKHRAIENAVRQKLAKLVRANPELGRVEKLGDDAVRNAEKDDPNVVVFKEGGSAYAIRLEGTRGAAIANAFTERNRLNMKWADAGFSVFGKKISFRNFTRWSAGMATRYSPTFAIRNTTKDNIELANIIFSERGFLEGGKWMGKYVANRVRMAKTLAKYITTGKIDASTTEGDILDRYIKAGGLIAGGTRAEAFDSIKASLSPDAIEKEMKRGSSKTAAAAKHVLKSIAYLNEYAEMATRLGIFATEVKGGKSDAEAALFSRRATVDFNRHGDWTPGFNLMRLFSNSTLGATARAASALCKSKHGARMALAMFANGLARSLIEHYANEDEDKVREEAGNATGKDVSEFDRRTSLFYFRNGDKLYKVAQHESPFSLITYAGDCVGRWICGEIDGGKVAQNLGVETAEIAYNFLPMGSINLTAREGGLKNDLKAALVSGIFPSFLQPVAELGADVDFKGDPVFRRNFDKEMPDSANARAHTPDYAKEAAAWLNEASGGNRGRKGFIDFAPETIQKLVEGYGKNALRDVTTAYSVGRAVAKGDLSGLDPRNTPVKRDFVRPLDGNDGRYFEAVERHKADRKDFDTSRASRTKDENVAYLAAHPNAYNSVNQALGKIEDRVNTLRKMENGYAVPKHGAAVPHEWTQEQIDGFRSERRRLQAKYLSIMKQMDEHAKSTSPRP